MLTVSRSILLSFSTSEERRELLTQYYQTFLTLTVAAKNVKIKGNVQEMFVPFDFHVLAHAAVCMNSRLNDSITTA
ncbi:hypothetical protein KIN20_028462 [Parelaphostrongylus tenuis]|uniref:Uncharacterized protein n=1 Tax=Parelaphostrongylus tenuis TaxID=148309 RepID=A0AAD5R1L9_PARTN|nr:hypothetical protein KIN20_028462 [Parelaphostrongylus tenuis]